MLSICVPVLRRYDLLHSMLLSLQKSTVVPARVAVIDNGRNADQLRISLEHTVDRQATVLSIYTPTQPLGIAESWNWFIRAVPEERLIVNDDVVFSAHSLEKLLASTADLVWAKGCGFSCFLLRDACVRKIGFFDETISPGYGYYEDDDYLQRLDGRGTRPRSATAEEVDADVVHLHSATLKAASHQEILEHHRKFKIAQANYMKKWHVSEREMFGKGVGA